MTNFRLATLAAAAALALSLPARAEVVNAPTVGGTLGGTAVLSLTFNVPTAFDLSALTLTIDWPSAGLALNPSASTALGMSWPTFAALFEPRRCRRSPTTQRPASSGLPPSWCSR